MKEQVRIAYSLKQGDTLIKVAECFETTVNQILSDNKHIQPNKLIIGELLTIVPASIHFVKSTEEDVISQAELTLSNKMRYEWLEHTFWTYLYFLGFFGNLENQEYFLKRLLENPKEIATIFAPYYSAEITAKIQKLLEEHLQIAGQLFNALKNNNQTEFNKYDSLLYQNADQIAATFASINKNYNEEEIKKMMYLHLDLLKQIASSHKNRVYVQEIQAIEQYRIEILELADILTKGIVKQFPEAF